MSRDRVAVVPWYIPRSPSPRTTSIVLCRSAGGSSACICIRILTISIGLVATTWQRPGPEGGKEGVRERGGGHERAKAREGRGKRIRLLRSGFPPTSNYTSRKALEFLSQPCLKTTQTHASRMRTQRERAKTLRASPFHAVCLPSLPPSLPPSLFTGPCYHLF